MQSLRNIKYVDDTHLVLQVLQKSIHFRFDWITFAQTVGQGLQVGHDHILGGLQIGWQYSVSF